MAGHTTEPRDLRPQAEADPSLRRWRADQSAEATPGRWERDAAGHRESGAQDSTNNTSRVFFFVMAAIIALAIAVFLILHPQPGD